jgi:RHS repeat-associated protein
LRVGGADAVLNSAGAVVVRTSFDAWGARRDDDWVGAPSSTELQQIADTTRHGFTGHGMLDNVGLVHMNGRVYDPAIGRFMSADPFVVPMFGTQGLNRYAYTLNSPLSYTDPSGFVPGADPHNPGFDPPPGRPFPCCGGRGPTGGPNGTAGQNVDGSSRGHVGASQTETGYDVSTPSTAGGTDGWAQGTMGDFGMGLLRRDLDDAFQYVMLLSAARQMATGNVLGARMWGQLSTVQLFGPPDTNLGVLGYDLEPAAGVVVGGLYGSVRTISGRLAARGMAATEEAFHYTFARYLRSIQTNGLRQGTYATRSGTLSPLQAQIELALPANRGLPDALVRIDLAGLRQAGYQVPALTRVSSRFGLPGGGYEMQFPYPIPPQFITVIH